MCILALGTDCHPDWPLVVVHGRDEEWGRQTDPLAEHDGGLLFAKDALAGGTWMGLNSSSGAFASLTNVRARAPRPVSGPSRGALVLGALERPNETSAGASAYSAFNMWHGCAFPDATGHVMAHFTRSWPDSTAAAAPIASTAPAAAAASAAAALPHTAAEPRPWCTASVVVPPGEVVARSNEGHDELWPKSRQLRAATTELLAGLARGVPAAELRDALAALVSARLDEAALGALGGDAAQIAASPLPGWKEAVLQRGPLVSRRDCRAAAQANGLPDWEYGTTCQTVILSSARERCVYFFQRSVQNLGQAPLEWETRTVPWPSSPS